MDIKGYSAHVLVNGRKVKEYRHNGLTFIEAKDGTEFSIEVKNHATGRVLSVVSVDGLDILEGKPATKDSGGYIVKGGAAETFSGWRKSDTEVGAFKFTAKEKSYATEKGKGENNGIIAIKLFAERIKPIRYTLPKARPQPFPKWPDRLPTRPEPYWLGDPISGQPVVGGYVEPTYTGGVLRARGLSAGGTSLKSASLAPQSVNYSAVVGEVQDSMEAPSFDMGTTWGDSKVEKVVTTTFERGAELGTFEFYYASREALQAMGISLVTYKEVSLPQAFPTTSNYALPPKGWKS